jgi:hypothetical protein
MSRQIDLQATANRGIVYAFCFFSFLSLGVITAGATFLLLFGGGACTSSSSSSSSDSCSDDSSLPLPDSSDESELDDTAGRVGAGALAAVLLLGGDFVFFVYGFELTHHYPV